MEQKEYIERDAAINAILDARRVGNTAFVDPYYALARVKDIPQADVRPVVRGKWRLYSPLTDTYECDKCGYQVIDESFRTNYCPNCGADMREEP